MKNSISFIFCLFALYTLQGRGDSARWDFRIKGIDFKVGRSLVFTSSQQAFAVVRSATPEARRSLYNYDSLQLELGSVNYHPVRLRLSCVIGNNKIASNRFLRKSEFCFGLGLDIQNQGSLSKRFSNLRLQNALQAKSNVLLAYAYQCESIDLSYQFVSKVFLKHLAAYGGASVNFGYNTYKRIDMEDFFTGGLYIRNEQFSTSYYSGLLHAGLKYNLSCELNLMVQAETGLNTYGALIGGHAVFRAISFGMRYKLIDEQDRKNYMNSSFW